jgi:hypothetical protein
MESENIAAVPGAETYPMYGVYRDELLANETYLSGEIIQLWEMHRCYSGDIKAEQFRQRCVGNTLGQLLLSMKRILVTPGRNGKWSGWLKEHGISRATADRLVIRYAEAHNMLTESAHEQLHEPSESEIGKLFAALWGRMEKTLTTSRSRYEFLRCFLYRSGLTYRWDDDGIMTFEPGHEPAPAPTDHDADSAIHCLTGDDGDVL